MSDTSVPDTPEDTAEEKPADPTERRIRFAPWADAELKRGLPLVMPTVFPGSVSWSTLYPKKPVLELEIGFGRPHFLIERAHEVKDHVVVGVEWKGKWAHAATRRAKREGLDNVCAIHGNAQHLVGALFAPNTLSSVFLNFPDPWWKSRHKKRRVIEPTLAATIASRMKPGATFLVQTDVASLLEDILSQLEAEPTLENVAGPGRLSRKVGTKASTHREKKCVADGVPVFRALLTRR